MPQLKKAYVRVYSEAEISSLSRKELEQAFMTLQESNQGLDFKRRADSAEKFVAEKGSGVLCDSIHSAYDVLSASGHKLEIKVSKLRRNLHQNMVLASRRVRLKSYPGGPQELSTLRNF